MQVFYENPTKLRPEQQSKCLKKQKVLQDEGLFAVKKGFITYLNKVTLFFNSRSKPVISL